MKLVNSRLSSSGYTILELMIVLIVSATIFTSALVVYSQQNRRTQFSESVQTFAQTLQDVLNDVETGYYPSSGDFECSTPGPNQPIITDPGTAQQGTNLDCIFVGKAIQFASDSFPSSYDIFTIVGRRLVGPAGSEPVTTLADSKPIGLNKLVERKTLSGGVTIMKLISVPPPSSPLTPIEQFSLLAMVTDSDGGGITRSGFNTRTTLAVMRGTLSQATGSFTNDPNDLDNLNTAEAAYGVNICLAEDAGGGGRQAVVVLGTNQSKISIETKIDTPCPI